MSALVPTRMMITRIGLQQKKQVIQQQRLQARRTHQDGMKNKIQTRITACVLELENYAGKRKNKT
jgi:hypothetical protein